MTKLQEELINEVWQESSQPVGDVGQAERQTVTNARAAWDEETDSIVFDASTESGQQIALRLRNPELLAETLHSALSKRSAEPGDNASA